MNFSPAILWAQLRHTVFPVIPPSRLAGLQRTLAHANWLHAVCLGTASLVMNALFGLLPELHYYRTGLWTPDRLHLALTWLHVAMILITAVALPVMIRARPASPDLAGPRQDRLALAYCVTMLFAVTLFSIVEQRLTGSISAYLLGLAVFATLFYTSPRFSLAAFAASFVLLLAGSLALQTSRDVAWHHLFVAFDAIGLFWLGSRVVFSLKAANHLQLVTIEEQAHALAASNAELARANQFKTDLLNLAAHDIRDPLNTISLSAQTLRTDLPADSPLQPLVAGIDESARHLSEFVRNLLTDIACDAHQLHLERVATPLPSLVEGVVSALRPAADAKSIALHFAVDASAQHAPAARVDPACFRQIVENLLTNALKYSPARKRVWVELSYTPAEGHRLAVRDEGPGLSAADQARLFRKYQRLSARPTNGEISTGLGLFIVKHLVTLHQGRVWAESPGPGRGATFVVALA